MNPPRPDVRSLARICLPAATALLLLAGCGGGSKALSVNPDMPEVCQGIDFNLNVEMREICGVQVRNYRAYKNIVSYRALLRPKDGKIVNNGGVLELRLPKTLPIALPPVFNGKIDFSENVRTEFLRSDWDYQEFFRQGTNERIQMMKIDVPLSDGTKASVCYTIPPRAAKVSQVQAGYANSIKELSCDTFAQWKREAEGQ